MERVLVKYSEIALKGKNRYIFENQLVKNIKLACKKNNVKLTKTIKERFRLVFLIEASRDDIIKVFSKVFGIKHFSFIDEVERTIDAILDNGKKILLEFKEEGIEEISFKTKRSDKRFEVKSPDVNSKLGEIATDLGLKVNYKSDNKLFVEITEKGAYMHTKRISGLDGLPVGTSGRVLVLLSGGIDSPVGAYQIMKRGCTVDFIHFHTFENNKEVLDTKIVRMVQKVNEYGGQSKLYTMPCRYYSSLTLGKLKFPNYRLVMFKHFIFKLAEKVAVRDEYDAILTGDSLAQVASQTIENMRATEFGIQVPVFRPLLCYEKETIIKIARDIDTYDLSIEEYKDCCSLLADNPETKAKLDKMQIMLDDLKFDEVIENCVDKVDCFDVE